MFPNPASVTVPGIVDFEDLEVVRTGTSGFVREIHVRDEQYVEKGTLLVELVNDDVTTEYHELLHRIEQSRIRYRMAVETHQTAVAQVELRNRQALEKQLLEKQRQYDALTVRAPVSGRVVARQLAQMQDAYIVEGNELLSIGNDQNKELVLSIAHDEIDEVLPLVGASIYARIGTRSRLWGTLKQVDPRASTQLTHFALAATDGGPLTVTETEEPEVNEGRSLQLVEPRFKATVELPEDKSVNLFCGERGYAVLGRRRSSIGSDLHSWVRDWVEERLQ